MRRMTTLASSRLWGAAGFSGGLVLGALGGHVVLGGLVAARLGDVHGMQHYGSNLPASVREVTDRVDATFDAAGKGGLQDAITLTGGSERVITQADEHAAELGVRLSAPTPDRAPDGGEIGTQLLASGDLRWQQSLQL
jgi:hypothetical protein